MCMQQVMCAHQNGPNSLPCGSRWAPVGARDPQQFDLTLCVCVCVCGKDASVDSSEADGSVRSALHGGPLK